MLRQTGQSAVGAPTLGGEARVDGARAAARGIVGATLASANRWSAQGDLTASWFAIDAGIAATEIGGSATALRYNGAPSATSGMLALRQHVRLASFGAWIGGGGGGLARPKWHTPIASAEAGAWTQRGNLRTSLAFVAQRARLDTPYTDTTGKTFTATKTTPPLVALDAIGLAEWRGGAWELTASATARRATRQRTGILGSAYATTALWVAPRTALTLSAGTLAADPLRALPGRRVVAFGVRWRPSGPTRGNARTSATPAVTIVRRDGRTTLHVRAPGATSVELRGDCTSWQSRMLTANGDAFELEVPLASGTQRLALRIDGGAWIPPANLPSVEDDFGERVGLLVVP